MDTSALKVAAGLIPPEEKPVKVTDPKVLAELAKEHPDLDLSALACKSKTEKSPLIAKAGVQAETKESYKGQSTFTW